MPALSIGRRHTLNVSVLSSETGGPDEAGPTGRWSSAPRLVLLPLHLLHDLTLLVNPNPALRVFNSFVTMKATCHSSWSLS